MIERLDLRHYIEYHKDGVTHRPNGPAIIWKKGNDWSWALFGVKHRYYGPQWYERGSWYIHGEHIKNDRAN